MVEDVVCVVSVVRVVDCVVEVSEQIKLVQVNPEQHCAEITQEDPWLMHLKNPPVEVVVVVVVGGAVVYVENPSVKGIVHKLVPDVESTDCRTARLVTSTQFCPLSSHLYKADPEFGRVIFIELEFPDILCAKVSHVVWFTPTYVEPLIIAELKSMLLF